MITVNSSSNNTLWENPNLKDSVLGSIFHGGVPPPRFGGEGAKIRLQSRHQSHFRYLNLPRFLRRATPMIGISRYLDATGKTTEWRSWAFEIGQKAPIVTNWDRSKKWKSKVRSFRCWKKHKKDSDSSCVYLHAYLTCLKSEMNFGYSLV